MSRPSISPELAAEALFLSDRTCCVCREQHRKVEIHHLDSDPTNNVLSNLIVLCKDCHSDAHTTHAFARNLTPALLRKYSDSWRDIVRLKVAPGGVAADELELRSQVLLELYLAPYRWKNRYMDLYPGQFRDSVAWISDGWEYLIENSTHQYTTERFEHYKSLFTHTGPAVADRIEDLVQTYGTALSAAVKVQVLRTASYLRIARIAYLNLPSITQEFPDAGDIFLLRQFTGVLETLMALSRLANQEREAVGNRVPQKPPDSLA